MSEENNQVGTEVEVRAAELDAKLGALLPAAEKEFVFDVSDPVEVIARSVGEIFGDRRELFFRASDRVVVARGADGMWEVMDPTWAVSYFPTRGVRWTKGKRRTNIPEKLAAQILRATEFRDALPRLNGVNSVRLPVIEAGVPDDRGDMRRKGFEKVRLLPVGYDAASGIWTEDTLDYPDDMHPEDAREWLVYRLRYFPWTDQNRLAVHVSAMLSVYCREMFPGRPPLYVWNSNMPGSGKSRLAEMICRMIFGSVGSVTLDQGNPRELKELLHTCALNEEKVVWFDDVEGKLFSPELRSWATAASRGGRLLGGQKKFLVPVRAATFFTGTHLKIDEHLGRRSLYVDLFPRQAVGQRQLPKDAIEITDLWMDDPANRRQFLACLWACVRNWDEAHRPLGSRPRMESFEGWSRVVPGAVAAMAFGDCLAPFEAVDAGDLDTSEANQLVEALIRKFGLHYGGEGHCDGRDIIAEARIHGLFRHVLGELDYLVEDLEARPRWRWETKSPDGIPTDGEKRRQAARYRDQTLDSKWGKLWNRLACAGRVFELDGRSWEFGARHSNRGRRYDITEVGLPA